MRVCLQWPRWTRPGKSETMNDYQKIKDGIRAASVVALDGRLGEADTMVRDLFVFGCTMADISANMDPKALKALRHFVATR